MSDFAETRVLFLTHTYSGISVPHHDTLPSPDVPKVGCAYVSGHASSSRTGLAHQNHRQCVFPSHSVPSHPHKVPGTGVAFQQASSTSLRNGPFQAGSMWRLRVLCVQLSPWLPPTPGHPSPAPSAHVPVGPRPPTRREADAVPVLELQPVLAELALAFLHPRLLLAQLVDDDVELAAQDVDLPLGQLLLAASQQLLLVLLLQRSPRQLLLPGAELLGAAGPRTMSRSGCQCRKVRPEGWRLVLRVICRAPL